MLTLTTKPKGRVQVPLFNRAQDAVCYLAGAVLDDNATRIPVPPTVALTDGCFWFQLDADSIPGITAVCVSKRKPQEVSVLPHPSPEALSCYLFEKGLHFGTVVQTDTGRMLMCLDASTSNPVPLAEASLIGHVIAVI